MLEVDVKDVVHRTQHALPDLEWGINVDGVGLIRAHELDQISPQATSWRFDWLALRSGDKIYQTLFSDCYEYALINETFQDSKIDVRGSDIVVHLRCLNMILIFRMPEDDTVQNGISNFPPDETIESHKIIGRIEKYRFVTAFNISSDLQARRRLKLEKLSLELLTLDMAASLESNLLTALRKTRIISPVKNAQWLSLKVKWPCLLRIWELRGTGRLVWDLEGSGLERKKIGSWDEEIEVARLRQSTQAE